MKLVWLQHVQMWECCVSQVCLTCRMPQPSHRFRLDVCGIPEEFWSHNITAVTWLPRHIHCPPPWSAKNFPHVTCAGYKIPLRLCILKQGKAKLWGLPCHEVTCCKCCGEVNWKDRPLSCLKDAMLRTQMNGMWLLIWRDLYSLCKGDTNIFLVEKSCWALEYCYNGLDLCGTHNADMWQMSEMASDGWGLREVTGSRVSRVGEVDGWRWMVG